MKKLYLVDFMTTKCGYLYDFPEYYKINDNGISNYIFDSMEMGKLIVEETKIPFYVREILTGMYIPLVSYKEEGLVKGIFPLIISSFVMGKIENDKIIISNTLATEIDIKNYILEHHDKDIFKETLNSLIRARSKIAKTEYMKVNKKKILILREKRS